mmetsp:Transcript_15775/g.40073  ORF Transcript_15775/g.40073 Transcript_15775/m.40073 type:complete len:264 (-) Transcript_15775:173-964(-)
MLDPVSCSSRSRSPGCARTAAYCLFSNESAGWRSRNGEAHMLARLEGELGKPGSLGCLAMEPGRMDRDASGVRRPGCGASLACAALTPRPRRVAACASRPLMWGCRMPALPGRYCAPASGEFGRPPPSGLGVRRCKRWCCCCRGSCPRGNNPCWCGKLSAPGWNGTSCPERGVIGPCGGIARSPYWPMPIGSIPCAALGLCVACRPGTLCRRPGPGCCRPSRVRSSSFSADNCAARSDRFLAWLAFWPYLSCNSSRSAARRFF